MPSGTSYRDYGEIKCAITSGPVHRHHHHGIGEYLPLQCRGCNELEEGWCSALPLSRRGSRTQSLGNRRRFFGRTALAVWSSVEKMAQFQSGLITY
jgi:hypothetical protein